MSRVTLPYVLHIWQSINITCNQSLDIWRYMLLTYISVQSHRHIYIYKFREERKSVCVMHLETKLDREMFRFCYRRQDKINSTTSTAWSNAIHAILKIEKGWITSQSRLRLLPCLYWPKAAMWTGFFLRTHPLCRPRARREQWKHSNKRTGSLTSIRKENTKNCPVIYTLQQSCNQTFVLSVGLYIYI